MGSSSILMDFAKAYRQADQLDNISQQLSSMAGGQFNSTLQGVSGAWKGENATKFIDKGILLQEQIKKTAQNIHQSAETVRNIAKRLQAAEEAAKALIK